MSILTIIKIVLTITVLGLFLWTFKSGKNYDEDTFKYGRYMIYLVVLEVLILLVLSFYST